MANSIDLLEQKQQEQEQEQEPEQDQEPVAAAYRLKQIFACFNMEQYPY